MLKIHLNKSINIQNNHQNLHFDMELFTPEIIGLYGPSGVGKTTILQMISGIAKPDNGIIEWKNRSIFDSEKKINLPIHQRKIGYIFQDGALFPNMNVIENIEFASKKNTNSIHSILHQLDITHLAKKKIFELSGGQKQAVALARVLVNEPEILLMDEPLSAIDTEWQLKLIEVIKSFQVEHQIPLIYVSHSSDELLGICEKMVVMTDYSSSVIISTKDYFNSEIKSSSDIKLDENGNYLIPISKDFFPKDSKIKISLIK